MESSCLFCLLLINRAISPGVNIFIISLIVSGFSMWQNRGSITAVCCLMADSIPSMESPSSNLMSKIKYGKHACIIQTMMNHFNSSINFVYQYEYQYKLLDPRLPRSLKAAISSFPCFDNLSTNSSLSNFEPFPSWMIF